jgi:Tol biopolymer transport system component
MMQRAERLESHSRWRARQRDVRFRRFRLLRRCLLPDALRGRRSKHSGNLCNGPTVVTDSGPMGTTVRASSLRRAWIGGVTALTVASCAGETTSAPMPSASSTASSHGAPTPARGLPARGRIAFSLQAGLGYPCNIMTIEPDGTHLRMLTNVAAGSCYGNPTWTPTGDRILFDGGTNNSDHLFSISAAGGSMRQLLSGSALESDPAISPEGTRIAFDRGSPPNTHASGIFLMNVDGSHVTRITTPPAAAAGGDAFPSFSPDGTKLAFVRYGNSDGTGGAIYIVGVDGKGLRQVTPTTLDAARPHWSPNGSKLLFGTPGAFVVTTLDGSNVYVVNVDGSGLTELTHFVGNDWANNPAWSPDGTMIVFDQFVDGTHYVALVVMRADGSLPTVIWHPTPKLDVTPQIPAWGTAP